MASLKPAWLKKPVFCISAPSPSLDRAPFSAIGNALFSYGLLEGTLIVIEKTLVGPARIRFSTGPSELQLEGLLLPSLTPRFGVQFLLGQGKEK